MSHDPENEYIAYSARNRRLVTFLQGNGYISPGSSILDIGSGSGHILSSVAEMIPDVEITCLEPNEQASSFLRGKGFSVVRTLNEITGPYKLVTLIEVIEHVDNPVSLLRDLKPMLAPNGALFCTTPCGELRDGSRNTNAYDTPEHVGFFTEQSLRLALNNAGFEKCAFTRIWQLYPYPSLLDLLIYELIGRVKDFCFGRNHLVCFAS
jgi:cyclopropane fatty-acyl-phospholipid synthase-like methyltransferase